MKLTSKKLKRIIKEELKKLEEGQSGLPTIEAKTADGVDALIEMLMNSGQGRKEAIEDLQKKLEMKKTGM
jgi:hypothetical protein